MTALLIAVAFVLSVAASALFSGVETGLYTTSRLRLYLDAQAGLAVARRARRLLRSLPRLLAVLLVANNLANYGATLSAQLLLAQLGFEDAGLAGTAMVTAVIFLFAESVPKSAFRKGREQLLYPVIPVLAVVYAVVAPLIAPVTLVASRLSIVLKRRSRQHAPLGEEVLATGVAEGLLTPFQERVARGVLAMRSRGAGDEATSPDAWPTALLGRPGVTVPEGSLDHRVLVRAGPGGTVLGWVPLALLLAGPGRVARRSDLSAVARVGAATSLDRVYAALDASATPFAVLPDGRVVDGTRLRRRIMGLFGSEAVATPSEGT